MNASISLFFKYLVIDTLLAHSKSFWNLKQMGIIIQSLLLWWKMKEIKLFLICNETVAVAWPRLRKGKTWKFYVFKRNGIALSYIFASADSRTTNCQTGQCLLQFITFFFLYLQTLKMKKCALIFNEFYFIFQTITFL